MSDLQARIDVLRPAAGDAIVVSVPGRLTNEQLATIRGACLAGLPSGIKVLVLDSGISLAHMIAPHPDPELAEAEALGFDAWMRKRTNDAHVAYMERTSKHLACDWRITRPSSPEEISRLYNIPMNEAES